MLPAEESEFAVFAKPSKGIDAGLRAEHVEDQAPDKLVGRSASRAVSVQALYESDLSNRRVELCLGRIASEQSLSSRQLEFARELAVEVELHRGRYDASMDAYTLQHRSGYISPVVRNILRVALAENRIHPETNVSIIISEAVKMAKRFDTDGAGRFVNGVLGAMSRDGELK